MARELAALCLLGLAACKSHSGGADPTPTADHPRQHLASAPFFRLEAEVAPCASGAPCKVSLVLSALGDYKLNKEYPFKLVPHAQSAVAIRQLGKLERASDQRGVMKLETEPTTLPAALTGVFKLSVCTEDVCEIADPEISVTLAAAAR